MRNARSRRARRGQATSEYMVLISFLAVALIVAAWAFYGSFRSGVTHLAGDAAGLFGEGTADGSGDMR